MLIQEMALGANVEFRLYLNGVLHDKRCHR